jgi:anti-sigma factor RsiW
MEPEAGGAQRAARDHEEIAALLDEFAAGGLSPDAAERVGAHVAACEECRRAVETMRGLREEAAVHGEALLDGHPSADELADFALQPDGAAPPRLAAHVRACPTCAHEFTVTERARATAGLRSAPAWWARRLAASAQGVWPALGPAFGVLALLLAYPAYQGLVRLPPVRASLESAAAQLETLRSGEAEARRSLAVAEGRERSLALWSGGVQVLYFSAARRGDEEVPLLAMRPDQPFQPILVGEDLGNRAKWPADRRVLVTLRREADGSETWRHEAPVSELWDASNELIGLLVPASALQPGEHLLLLRAPPDVEPFYSARFRVAAGARGPEPAGD